MDRPPEPVVSLLARAFAGQTVRVPRDPETLMRKVETLSADEAKLICAAVGGSRRYGRKLTRDLAEARNDRIRVRRHQGATIEALAFEFDLSARHISNIIRSNTP